MSAEYNEGVEDATKVVDRVVARCPESSHKESMVEAFETLAALMRSLKRPTLTLGTFDVRSSSADGIEDERADRARRDAKGFTDAA